jgi:hypothetical protein
MDSQVSGSYMYRFGCTEFNHYGLLRHEAVEKSCLLIEKDRPYSRVNLRL